MTYNIGINIVKMRERCGLTQAELARKIGISRSSVNAWELGMATPQLKHIVEMAKIFSTTVDEMLNISSDIIINLSDLTESERKAVFSVVECFREKRNVEI